MLTKHGKKKVNMLRKQNPKSRRCLTTWCLRIHGASFLLTSSCELWPVKVNVAARIGHSLVSIQLILFDTFPTVQWKFDCQMTYKIIWKGDFSTSTSVECRVKSSQLTIDRCGQYGCLSECFDIFISNVVLATRKDHIWNLQVLHNFPIKLPTNQSIAPSDFKCSKPQPSVEPLMSKDTKRKTNDLRCILHMRYHKKTRYHTPASPMLICFAFILCTFNMSNPIELINTNVESLMKEHQILWW